MDFASHPSLAVAPKPHQSLLSALLSDPTLVVRRVSVPAGTVLFEPETRAEHLYVIHRGQVRQYQVGCGGSTRLVEILGTDEWFGVGALTSAGVYGCRAVAAEPTVISELRADRVMQALTGKPEALLTLSRQLADKLIASQDDAAKLIFEDCRQRLVRVLIHFSRSAASTPREDGVVLHLTHSQLAQAIGVARETVSLTLTQLRQQNLLRTGRNRLFFNPDVLRQAQLNGNTNGHAHGNGHAVVEQGVEQEVEQHEEEAVEA